MALNFSEMIKNSTNYYCDATLKSTDDEKWMYLLNMVLYKADYVEFNIFRKGFNEIQEIKSISKYIVDKASPIGKIYPRNKFIRYMLHKDVINFIISIKYIDWKNFYLEDISLFIKGVEIFTTITHENYVIMLLDEAQYNELNNKGFNFMYFLPLNYSSVL